MPLRNKSFDELSPAQQKRVNKYFATYKRGKGRNNPNMTAEEYLPVLQTHAVRYLIGFFVGLPVYILLLMAIFS